MGKFGPRLSSRSKAKRWAKGQSSSSNPATKKHRDQARSSFFQPILPTSGLTQETLKKHDALQGIEPTDENIEIDENNSCDATTFKTFDTYATDYSNCSNMSFTRFLSHFQSNSIIHKEMLAVLAAITDVIKQSGGTESSTEYYAALMTTLEAAETIESVSASLSLLGMGMKTVPKNVLKLHFGQASRVFFQILTKYASEENFLILRHCIGCLSILLRVQESAAWSNPSTKQILFALMTFTGHSKPKVRKAAQHAICTLLKASDLMRSEDAPPFHPAAKDVAEYCLSKLATAGQPGQMTSTLHLLTLLKDIAHQLPKSSVKSLCEKLLSIMTLSNVLVTSCCLQTLHGLFVSKPLKATLPAELNAQIINAMYDYQPAPGDTQPTLAWLAVMQEAHNNLAQNSPELCAAYIPRMVKKCAELWLSDKQDVVDGASHTLKVLLETCAAQICTELAQLNSETEQSKRYKLCLVKIIQLIQQGMSYQYNLAWKPIFHLVACLFKIIGPVCQDEFTKDTGILVALAELRDSYKFSYDVEIDFAVGAAVRSLGAEVVLRVVPLQLPNGEVDIKRSWLLPILKDCTSNSRLGFFIEHLLPLAELCEQKSKKLQEMNDRIGAHSNELLSIQIWHLLPSFCNNATDITDSFMRIAKTLGTCLTSKKEIKSAVMSALRKLIQQSQNNNNRNDFDELSRFAKNYLPILFNLYTIKPKGTDEEGQRLACFETIKVYLKCTNKDLVGELFDKALDNLTKEGETDFFKESIFDLIRVLCQFTDIIRIRILYDKCTSLFADTKHKKEQKKAYRFLEEICGSESSECKQFVNDNHKEIQNVLIRSLPSVQKISKGARIRCITHLVERHPRIEKSKFLTAIVPEAVMGIKELNEKCRISSYTLLTTIANKLLDKEDDFKNYVNMLIAGLGGTDTYCSASLLALSSITFNFNGALGVETIHNILDHTCTLATSTTNEIVLSALSFIKVYLSAMPTTIIGPKLNLIVQTLTNMTDKCKLNFRLKVRDIMVKLMRKFGSEIIIGMVPLTDRIMHKRLKNMRKIEVRKQKNKDQKRNQNDEEEEEDEEFNVKRKPKTMEEILADDEEFDDSDEEKTLKPQKRKAKRNAYIDESGNKVVDLLDSAAAQNILATKPTKNNPIVTKEKSKDHGFKTAADGRLIIADSSDDEGEEDKKKKKKKNKLKPYLGSDSENDAVEDDVVTMKSAMSALSVNSNKTNTGLKRKRMASVSTESVVSDARSFSSKYKAGGSGIHRPLKAFKREKEPGEEYRHKKAFGDVKVKGKPDPFAYIPIKRSDLNKRKKGRNSKTAFKTVLSRSKKDKQAQKNSRSKRKF